MEEEPHNQRLPEAYPGSNGSIGAKSGTLGTTTAVRTRVAGHVFIDGQLSLGAQHRRFPSLCTRGTAPDGAMARCRVFSSLLAPQGHFSSPLCTARPLPGCGSVPVAGLCSMRGREPSCCAVCSSSFPMAAAAHGAHWTAAGRVGGCSPAVGPVHLDVSRRETLVLPLRQPTGLQGWAGPGVGTIS